MSPPTTSSGPPRWLRLLSIPFGVVPGWGHIVLGKTLRGFVVFFFFALFANFALLSFVAWPALASRYVAPACGAAAAILWVFSVVDLLRLAVWRHRPGLRPLKDEALREGMTRFLADDLPASRAAFMRLVRLDREDPDGHFHLGTVAAAEGKWTEARRHWKRCLAVDVARKWAEEVRAELAKFESPPSTKPTPKPTQAEVAP